MKKILAVFGKTRKQDKISDFKLPNFVDELFSNMSNDKNEYVKYSICIFCTTILVTF